MTQKEANKFMNEQFENFAQKAQSTENDDEEIKFTDAAHKLFITLTQMNAFEEEAFPKAPNTAMPS